MPATTVPRDAYEIGPAETGDLRPVLRLAWRLSPQILPGTFFEHAAQEQPEYFRVVKRRDDGTVAGFVLAFRLPLRDDHLLLLVLEPNLIGQGLRKALLAQVQEVLRREGEMGMSVGIPLGNRSLIDFYEHAGFHVIGVQPGAAGNDEVVLAKAF